MTKLHSPRGWLGYFVGCESEAMYHIYSSEKHKVFQIGAARIKDSKGLGDPHNAPCLEDQIPTEQGNIPEQLDSETDNELLNSLRSGNNNLLSVHKEAGLDTEQSNAKEASI